MSLHRLTLTVDLEVIIISLTSQPFGSKSYTHLASFLSLLSICDFTQWSLHWTPPVQSGICDFTQWSLHWTPPVQSGICDFTQWSLALNSTYDPLHWTLPLQFGICDFTQWSPAPNSTCSVWYLWLYTMVPCTEVHLFSLVSETSHSDPLHQTLPVQSGICDFTQWSLALNSTCSVWYLWLHTVIPCTELYLFSLVSVTVHSDPLHWTPPVQFGICDFTQWSLALNCTYDPLHWTLPVQSGICDFTQWSSAPNSTCSVWYLWLYTVIPCTELHLFSLVSETSHSDPLHWTQPVQFGICDFTQWSSALNSTCSVSWSTAGPVQWMGW